MGRDVKGLGAPRFAGEVTRFTGAHGPDEPPACPHIAVDTTARITRSRATLVIAQIEECGLISSPVAT